MKRLMVFCYAPYPNEEWEALFTHAADIAFAVINVNSGVGDELDPVYVAMVKRLQAAGIRCLGYVSSRYGERLLDEVKAEINVWFSRYHVDGVFCDEMSSSADFLPYYRRVKSACGSAVLVTNPGTLPNDAYRELDAIICVAETDQQTYLSKSFPEWTKIVPDSVCHIVFSVTDAAKVLAKINSNANGCYFYLTTTVPKPGASGPEFNIQDSIWPPAESPAPTPVPAPPATARMLSTCSTDQLLEEVRNRIDK